MGLDITAYSRLVSVGLHADDWCEDDDHIEAYAYSTFPASVRGLPILGREPQVEAREFVRFGCFTPSSDTLVHRFRAGSYSGYGRWRTDLQQQFNPGREPSKPFYELIWFADNEGVIGPEAAGDLLVDFQDHAQHYDVPLHGWELYDDWTQACRLAADGGLIHFH